MAQDPSLDPNRLLASLVERRVTLDLGTIDLCFVAALYVRAQGSGLTSFGEQELVGLFEEVCARVDPAAENLRKRATHAIQRLRDQRMLARIDGAFIARAGEYTLSRLASGIVEFFLHEEALTPESLTLLTRTLQISLDEVAAAARAAQTEHDWHTLVHGPLRVTVTDLVAGIERRQRGLDVQQEALQKEIAELLGADWFGAVERCQGLLDRTSATLRELNEVLLRDTHQLHASLQDVLELCVERGNTEGEEVTHRVVEQVDRIAAWGSARQQAWSDYYQYVHRYLRDVVRLDPTRALTERLRAQLSGKAGRAFALTVARAPSMQLLRDVVAPPERPPVKRPRKKREEPPEVVSAEDPRARLEARVRQLIASGVTSLAEVTARVADEVREEERFATAGRVAETVARLAKPRADRERPWRPIRDGLEIEEWALRRQEPTG